MMISKQTFHFTAGPITYFVCLGGLLVAMNSCGVQADISPSTASFQENVVQTEVAQSAVNLVHMNLDEAGVALRGYDPVAYFTESEAVQGQEAYSFLWKEATWHFATAENRDLFSLNPEQYAPANGGYCTFGIVLRKKFDGDPRVWSVIKSRLYVFLNEEVQQKFLQDSTGNLQKVSANWSVIQFKAPEEL